MGAKLQKINNKNTKFMRVGGGNRFLLAQEFIIGQTYLNATKTEDLSIHMLFQAKSSCSMLVKKKSPC